MWGQNWAQMIWGGAAALVPALGPLSLLVLGGLLVLVGRHVVVRRGAGPWRTALVAVLAVTLPWSAQALGPMPLTFTNGTVADAIQVNANFNFLRNAIITLETQALPRTRYLTIPAVAFTPLVPGDTRYVLDNRVILRKLAGVGGSVTLTAPVYLPDGAVITLVTAYVEDVASAVGENIQVKLLRSGLASYSPGATSIPTIDSDTAQPTDFIDGVSTPTVNESVQANNRSLFIEATLNGTTGSPKLNQVQIQYLY